MLFYIMNFLLLVDLLKEIINSLTQLKDTFLGFKPEIQWTLLSPVIIYLYKCIIKLIKNILNITRGKKSKKNDRSAYFLNIRDLDHRGFSKEDINEHTRFFIQTKYQSIPSSNFHEPCDTELPEPKQELIPELLKIFSNDINISSKEKYCFLLADSGMGKTTFIINFYLTYLKNRYKNKEKYKYNIEIFCCSDENLIDKLNDIRDKENKILLLDSLDEDPYARNLFEKRFSSILEAIKPFRFVLITCRTQFFSSSNDIPIYTGDISRGNNSIRKDFNVKYISPFDVDDIYNYLSFVYPGKVVTRRNEAFKLITKIPYLAVRPMLLKHIDELLYDNQSYFYSYKIYETLVEKWISREAKKEAVKDHGTVEERKSILYNFSLKLALYLYEQDDNYKIKKSELLKFCDIKKELFNNLFDHIAIKVDSKSLLNRDSNGNFKFSHKSIFEYFLALNRIKHKGFHWNMNGNDYSDQFYKEMLIHNFIDKFTCPVQEVLNIINKDKFKLYKLTYHRNVKTDFYTELILPDSINKIEILFIILKISILLNDINNDYQLNIINILESINLEDINKFADKIIPIKLKPYECIEKITNKIIKKMPDINLNCYESNPIDSRRIYDSLTYLEVYNMYHNDIHIICNKVVIKESDKKMVIKLLYIFYSSIINSFNK